MRPVRTMTVQFRRPMFWDDRLDVWRRDAGEGNAAPAALTVLNGDGKVVNDCTIETVAYGP